MSHDCGHETYSGHCVPCDGEGATCEHGPDCTCPGNPCPACNGSGECASCVAAFAQEDAYWSAYFGKAIDNEAQQRRLEREDYGRELTDGERMEEARRLK
jgi:hypothetical protein